MNALRSKPAKISLVLSLLMLLFSFTFIGDRALDIQMHDTYFVTSHAFIYRLLAIFYFVSALFYEVCFVWLTPGKGNVISYSHFLISTICFVLIGMVMVPMTGTPRRYYSFSNYETFDNFNLLTQVFSLAFIMSVFSNLVFGFYYLYCLVKKFITVIQKR